MASSRHVLNAKSFYRRIFSLDEFDSSIVLQYALLALLLASLANTVFSYGAEATIQAVENNTHVCWPYFPTCGDWYM